MVPKMCLTTVLKHFILGSWNFVNFNPITYGWAFLAQTIRLLTIILKRPSLAPPDLVTFCFYLSETFWQNFSKIDSPRGCCICFWNETSPKIEHINFFVLLQNHRNAGGINFMPEKMFSLRHKKWFFLEFCSIPGGKYQIARAISILEKKFLWRHISKSRIANSLKFCMFTCIISLPLLVPNFNSIR